MTQLDEIKIGKSVSLDMNFVCSKSHSRKGNGVQTFVQIWDVLKHRYKIRKNMSIRFQVL